MIRRVGIMLSLLAPLACSLSDLVGTTPSISGTWVPRTIDGTALPWTSPDSAYVFLYDTLVFSGGYSYAQSHIGKRVSAGRPDVADVYTRSGVYRQEGTDLTFDVRTGGSMTATFDGSRIVLSLYRNSPVFVYTQ